MGKTGKLRKKLKRQRDLANAVGIATTGIVRMDGSGGKGQANGNGNNNSTNGKDGEMSDEVIDTVVELVAGSVSKDALATTIRVLQYLGREPELYHHPDFKLLRAAVRPLVVEQQAMDKGSLTARISDALKEKRWAEAIDMLGTMRHQNETPKLGAFQRWVRDCDILGSTSVGVAENREAIRLMDAILRVSAALHGIDIEGDDDGGVAMGVSMDGDGDGGGEIKVFPAWRAIATPLATADEATASATRLLNMAWDDVDDRFRVVASERGANRIPPNEYDLKIYASYPEPGRSFNWDVTDAARIAAVKRHDVPFVPGAFLLENVLSPRECEDIIKASNGIGYTPDEPVGSRPGLRAANVVWMIDDSTQAMIEARVRPYLPQHLDGPTHELGSPACLNARFRLYRYQQGNVYRPHVDGAWPGSGYSEDGTYMYDAFDGRLWSRLTFLVYLNEGMEGGSTTFYLPSPKEQGTVHAYGVTPSQGSVLVFPHGGTCGSLVHEGSAVTAGVKYVIRSDVLYTAGASDSHMERRAKRHHSRQSAGGNNTTSKS